MENKCPFCKARKLLQQAGELIAKIPEIGAEFYDDPIRALANDIDNAESTFRCYCNAPVDELPVAIQAQIREFPR
jgi:hypothetical protein